MHIRLPSIAAGLAAFGLAHSTPFVVGRQDTNIITPPDRYYLQTRVTDNSADYGTNKDGLWVVSYHTGAGLGDAALSHNKSTAWEGYLNGTRQLFTYPNNLYPWPMWVRYGGYQSWYVTTISVASQPPESDPGFYFNASGLQYNYTGSQGWLVCDWWHGYPQLFSLGTYLYGNISSSCSKVELYPISV